MTCVAYLDPRSESRNERANRLEKEEENGVGVNDYTANSNGAGNAHKGTDADDVHESSSRKVEVVGEQ
jgi:PAB1-binding protein PBP1